MLRGHLLLIPLLLVIPSAAQKKTVVNKAPGSMAQAKESSARLPVKRVVLYKNGVGYFEHTARVHGTQD